MFGATDSFEPRVRIELAQDVLDMVADRGGADVQPVGDIPRRAASCQKTQDLNFPRAEIARSRRRARSNHGGGLMGRQVRSTDHEVADHQLQRLAHIAGTDNVNCIGLCETLGLGNYY